MSRNHPFTNEKQNSNSNKYKNSKYFIEVSSKILGIQLNESLVQLRNRIQNEFADIPVDKIQLKLMLEKFNGNEKISSQQQLDKLKKEIKNELKQQNKIQRTPQQQLQHSIKQHDLLKQGDEEQPSSKDAKSIFPAITPQKKENIFKKREKSMPHNCNFLSFDFQKLTQGSSHKTLTFIQHQQLRQESPNSPSQSPPRMPPHPKIQSPTPQVCMHTQTSKDKMMALQSGSDNIDSKNNLRSLTVSPGLISFDFQKSFQLSQNNSQITKNTIQISSKTKSKSSQPPPSQGNSTTTSHYPTAIANRNFTLLQKHILRINGWLGPKTRQSRDVEQIKTYNLRRFVRPAHLQIPNIQQQFYQQSQQYRQINPDRRRKITLKKSSAANQSDTQTTSDLEKRSELMNFDQQLVISKKPIYEQRNEYHIRHQQTPPPPNREQYRHITESQIYDHTLNYLEQSRRDVMNFFLSPQTPPDQAASRLEQYYNGLNCKEQNNFKYFNQSAEQQKRKKNVPIPRRDAASNSMPSTTGISCYVKSPKISVSTLTMPQSEVDKIRSSQINAKIPPCKV